MPKRKRLQSNGRSERLSCQAQDIKVRQDLAKEQELRNNIEGDIKTFADREKFLSDQIEGRFKNVFRLSGN